MGNTPSKKGPAGGLHAGHRARMRRRFLTGGLDAFDDHEVLELLLFYAVPRRDVNEMAHLLLQRFGTLAGVLDAPEEELCAVPGVGPGIAHFLNLVPQVMVQMARQARQEGGLRLSTSGDVQRLLDRRCPQGPVGQVLLVLTDASHEVVALHRYPSFDALTLREVATRASGARAAMVVLIERVEDCTGFPLPGRCQALDQLSGQLRALGTPLWDYFAVDTLGNRPRSYARTGQLLPY